MREREPGTDPREDEQQTPKWRTGTDVVKLTGRQGCHLESSLRGRGAGQQVKDRLAELRTLFRYRT